MNELKEYLLGQGASLVGFGDISGLYGDAGGEANDVPRLPVGVSIALALPKEVVRGIAERPTPDYYNAYYELNNRLDELAILCEERLKAAGYQAYAQTCARSRVGTGHITAMPHKTVATAAGVGWIGKSALLVTRQYGAAVRLTSVLTSAPLPCSEAVRKSPCADCRVCTEACSGHAIAGNVWDVSKGREWLFDPDACKKAARNIAFDELGKEITLCGKCIVVCPYTRVYINS